jgi:hypothetical protein
MRIGRELKTIAESGGLMAGQQIPSVQFFLKRFALACASTPFFTI